MWDAFEHVLMFISLYVFSLASSLLLHTFVDKWIPRINEYGQITDQVVVQVQSYMVRGFLASIIVSYPIFAALFLHLTKRTKQNPNLRSLKARKILIYLTLVIAFVVTITNVINAVYKFLSGNINLNFILHLAIAIAINGLIFVYYLTQVKEDRNYE